MTKHKIGMVNRIIILLLLYLDRYLFSVVSGNRYLRRVSKENVLSTTITGNIAMSSYV